MQQDFRLGGFITPRHISCPVLFLFLVLSLALSHAFLWAPEATAKESNATAPQTKDLILFTFGTTYDQDTDPLALVRKEISARHPDVTIHVAYSSAHVLKTLRAKGLPARNLAQVLADLMADGRTQIAVQSMHVVPGLEYDVAKDIVSRFQGMPKSAAKVTLGSPLLASHEDAKAAAAILAKSLPAERGKDDAVVFVGHGAISETGTLAYPALQCFLTQNDPKLFVGTIEGPFSLQLALEELKGAKAKKVWLVPLLTVVGDHAVNDIFGDEADSWKQTLTKAGILVVPVRQGIGAIPELAALWADHADAALKELE